MFLRTLRKNEFFKNEPNPYIELLNQGGEILTRRLRSLVTQKNVCILCACGEYLYCHRHSVSGYLEAYYNYNIVHI